MAKTPVVIYFHGLGCTANSEKAAKLRESLPEANFIALNLTGPIGPVSTHEVWRRLSDAINNIDLTDVSKIVFVGISLGGYYARIFGERYDVPYVLINPVTDPEQVKSLVTPEFLVDLKSINSSETTGSLVHLLLGDDDDVIPPEAAQSFFKYKSFCLSKKDDHNFENHWSLVTDLVKKVIEK